MAGRGELYIALGAAGHVIASSLTADLCLATYLAQGIYALMVTQVALMPLSILWGSILQQLCALLSHHCVVIHLGLTGLHVPQVSEVGGFGMTSTQLAGATAIAALLSFAAVAERKALRRCDILSSIICWQPLHNDGLLHIDVKRAKFAACDNTMIGHACFKNARSWSRS